MSFLDEPKQTAKTVAHEAEQASQNLLDDVQVSTGRPLWHPGAPYPPGPWHPGGGRWYPNPNGGSDSTWPPGGLSSGRVDPDMRNAQYQTPDGKWHFK